MRDMLFNIGIGLSLIVMAVLFACLSVLGFKYGVFWGAVSILWAIASLCFLSCMFYDLKRQYDYFKSVDGQ